MHYKCNLVSEFVQAGDDYAVPAAHHVGPSAVVVVEVQAEAGAADGGGELRRRGLWQRGEEARGGIRVRYLPPREVEAS